MHDCHRVHIDITFVSLSKAYVTPHSEDSLGTLLFQRIFVVTRVVSKWLLVCHRVYSRLT